jgi:PQQ-like domain
MARARVASFSSILLALLLATPRLALARERPFGGSSPSVTVWSDRYDAARLLDRAYDIGASPDGTRVFVTGESSDELGGRDWATIAYDATTGVRMWVTRYDGPGEDSYDVANALAVAPDGARVYVTGYGNPGFTTVAYDAVIGTQLWVARYADGIGTEIAVTPDGSKVIVAGPTSYGWHTIAYDPATGAQLWIVQFAQSAYLHGMALSADGARVFDTGDHYTGNNQDYVTAAYDTGTGLPLWTAYYDDAGHGDDHTRDVGVSPDGSRVFVTGMARPGSRAIFNTIAYDAATGAQLWVSTYDNRGRGGHVANALGVSMDGALVFVSGESWGKNSTDYGTVAYDADTGQQVWVARYNSPVNGPDAAMALGVDPAGGLVYVTGRSTGDGTNYDYATVGYDSLTGTQVWENRYDNPGHGEDQTAALAVGANGSVFVTGGSHGAGGRSDYATVGRVT